MAYRVPNLRYPYDALEPYIDEATDVRPLCAAARNNAGGQHIHCMLWRRMPPDGGGEPQGELGDAIGGA